MPSKMILVVDDEPDFSEILRTYCEALGFDVESARDGEEALFRVRSVRPVLIILDLLLPKLDGYQVCALLKNDSRTADIPIIMLTAKTDLKDEEQSFECGADAYVRKPFGFEELSGQMRRLLSIAVRSKTGA